MSAISREQGEIVLNRLSELRDTIAEDLIRKAEGLSDVVLPRITTSRLLTEGYKKFDLTVHDEYKETSFIDLAEILIPSFKSYFFTGGLKAQVSHIIDSKTK